MASFTVEFFKNGARTKLSGSVGQALSGASSETAVLQYLKQKYRTDNITIIKLDFKT